MTAETEGADEPKPTLLFAAHPLTGHITPALRVAAALAGRGFPVFFLGPTTHKTRIEAANQSEDRRNKITFLPLLGTADLDDLAYYAPALNNNNAEYWSLPWQQRGLLDFQHTWIDTIPDEWRSVVAALYAIRGDEGTSDGEGGGRPKRRVIVVAEAMFFGIMPLFLGAETGLGVPRPKSVALSVTVPFIRSRDLPAFFIDDDSDDDENTHLEEGERKEEERMRKRDASWRRWDNCTRHLTASMEERLREAGAVFPSGMGFQGPFLSGQNYTCHDAVLQLGVPGLFYPRSDWPSQFHFVGVLPPSDEPVGGWPNLPAWWDEIRGARGTGKKVVVVAQGTIEVDPNDLIIPTLLALAERESHLLVVAILGRKGATLPADFAVPANSRVTDYLHYDAVLPWADVWVHNGGYGAVQHGIAHGIPMVVTGEGQDKSENAKRIQRCGVGVNLRCASPCVEDIRRAIETVLGDESYRRVAAALRKESRDLSCFDAVERKLLNLAMS